MANVFCSRQVQNGWLTIDFWLCTMLMFLVEFGCAVLGAPSPRLLEMIVCREYYQRSHSTPTSEDCKIKEVQVQLGFVLTVLSTCSILAATLMQIPMGVFADKKGRKGALLLNITSTILYWGWIPFVAIFTNMPVWALYIAPIFLFIGGGPWASGALVFSTINRQISPSRRTPAFSIMEAVSGIADLVGPALGALTMEHHIWLPFLLATLSFTLMFVPTFLLGDEPMPLPIEVNATYPGFEACRSTDSEEQPLLHDISTSRYPRNSDRVTFIRSTSCIYVISFGSFFLLSLARDSNNFLIPWISWRFNESMARAGLIFSLRAIVSSLVFFVLLPSASSFASNIMRMGSFARDLLISTFSVVLLCVGSIMVAFSSNISTLVVGFCITTLGSGATVSLRAFLASKVDTSLSGRIFAAISATSAIGSLVGMPLMGTLYSLSISKEASSISLPFVVAAVAYFLVLFVIGSVRFSI
ncbi:major facilitator superfamily domain-containing protein [Hypoxylon argillaceum]|nr:major facilitator superfamily domain-containing protein [Hypoxylon argillaceum]